MRRSHRTPRARLGLERLDDRCTPATLPAGFTEAAVATGLSSATAMEFSPDGKLFVAEQAGTMEVYQGATRLRADFFADAPLTRYNPSTDTGLIDNRGERGLLGVAFDPNYDANRYVYVYYTYAVNPDGNTGTATTFRNRLVRFTANAAGDLAVAGSQAVLFELDNLSGATNHNGGAIHFGPDGKLYVAVGDNATGSNAQTLGNLHGKMLRLNADGSIPTDNPTTIDGLGATSGRSRAIYAAGLRNPFTFAFQPGTGRMYINEVGQNSWEEINEGAAGANYGWPGTEGDFNQSSFPNFTRPVYSYSHGGGTLQGFAITGGAFYNPATNQFPAEYAGDYFFGEFVNDYIAVFDPTTREVRRFASGTAGIVDLKVTGDGSLYYLARDAGQVVRVQYTAALAPAVTQQPASATVSAGGTATFTVAASGAAPLTYQWQKLVGSTWTDLANGTGVSGATTATLTLSAVDAADGGQYRAVVSNSAGTATSNAATLTVTANQAPSATINVTSGLTNGKFIAGQALNFSGTATDPEDGALGASAFTWRVDYITSIASGNPVVRPFVPEFGGVTTGTATPATTGPYTLADVAYRITLTVRDSAGLTSTVTLDVLPNVSTITLASTPSGLTLTLDGQPYTTPTSVQSVVGFQRPIGAAATQSLGGTTYQFQNWSDGGAATHTITTPLANTTYTATYAPVAAAFTADINFQLAGAAVPAGYRADTGAVFGARGGGLSYGWNADNASTARDRNAANSPDQRYDTLLHLQKPENPNAFWEIAVPNGTYDVRVVAGDPSHTDSVYRLLVEGVLAINATPTSATRWFEATVRVTVTDGRLTVSNAAGAQNNKINFIEIDQVVAAPATPPGLVASFGFNEGSGTATAGGTLAGGASWVAGRSAAAGSAVAFDGTGRVDVAGGLGGWLNGTATLAFWLRTTQAGNDTMWQAPGVTGAESAGDGNDVFWGWLDASGRIGVQAGDVAGAKSAAPVNDGQWHHIALTRDAATGAVRVYVDGVLSGSATSATGVKTTPFGAFGTVADTGGTPTFLNGALDDVLVFDRVLTASEVAGLAAG